MTDFTATISPATHAALTQALPDAESVIRRAAADHTRILSPLDADWPRLLPEHRDTPPFLWVKGALHPGDAVAVIGTRAPTPAGGQLAQKVAAHYAQAGYSVVSGLALGCDTRAHEGALSVSGHTTVVLGHGLDTVYPRQNAGLLRRVLAAGGAVVSIAPHGAPITKKGFVDRDFVQAGLALGVFVAQTDLHGGSWHACRAAQRYGRPVGFAPLPSETGSPKAAGPALLAAGGEALARHLRVPAERVHVVPLRSRADYPRFTAALTAARP
ncbi:DNA-processing protein DprA [Deinococcus soli (ex Cha et al. 2016)]|uniref:DNA processing protein n=2 Tax=Deinococcus soli (ex Cha et al. 2016) TaxID=1309411 RepID=A0ACC6KGZ8_9DEIO|nr:DNA-processing protein DprA [Deinococcus soli (ex Cha et al. 2016)]MDR6218882.1 DNA processing protein [Deinococcus soli (ex Cha et al. 2016)]MDR6328679.1 DNA processing protein [Deinococcus soli (ex Cha et al. 2016)]MDR6751834.1 DNA processing protein [Deinococcus soli (ex Cha et al. 2016)]